MGSSLALGIKAAHPATRVVALDNLKRRGSELNVARLREGGVEFVHGDIRNPEDLAAVESALPQPVSHQRQNSNERTRSTLVTSQQW